MSAGTDDAGPDDTGPTGWQQIADGSGEEHVAALLDGMGTVLEYRRKRGILDKRLAETGGIFGSRLSGGYEGWRDDPKPATYAQRKWREDCSHIHIHEAAYTFFERHGQSHCKITAWASASDDVNPTTGERVDNPYGVKGDITITGILPHNTTPAAYIEQYLDGQ